jgi:hypothetical protein
MNKVQFMGLAACGLALTACQQPGPPPSPVATPQTPAQIADSAAGLIRQGDNAVNTGCDIIASADDLIGLVPYLGTADKIAQAVCKAVKALPASKAPKVAGAPVTVKVHGVVVNGTRA